MGRKEIEDKWEGLGKGASKPPSPPSSFFFCASFYFTPLTTIWTWNRLGKWASPFLLGRNTRPKWATYRSYPNTVLLSFFFCVSEKQSRCERCFTTKASKVRLACFEHIFLFFILNTILSRGEEAFLHRLSDELLLNFGAKFQRWFTRHHLITHTNLNYFLHSCAP